MQDLLVVGDDLAQLLRVVPDKRAEARQCLCLHVGLAFCGTTEAALPKASELRRELWEASSEAFQHLGDAGAYISSAEAFVRHNAHDCIYPDHEKDFRVLQLFAKSYMRGKTLVVLRLSHPGLVELDVVKGEGASTELGLVIIHKGHMRASVCPPETIEGVVEVAKQGVRRGAYLEGHRPSPILATGAGAPCKAGQVEEDDLGDPGRGGLLIRRH